MKSADAYFIQVVQSVKIDKIVEVVSRSDLPVAMVKSGEWRAKGRTFFSMVVSSVGAAHPTNFELEAKVLTGRQNNEKSSADCAD